MSIYLHISSCLSVFFYAYKCCLRFEFLSSIMRENSIKFTSRDIFNFPRVCTENRTAFLFSVDTGNSIRNCYHEKNYTVFYTVSSTESLR